MALPHSDAFTNTDGTNITAHNASYTVHDGAADIQGNTCQGNDASATHIAWDGDTFNDDQYSEGVVDSPGGGSQYADVCVRMATGVDCYDWYSDSVGDTSLVRFDNSSETVLDSTGTDWSDGDTVRLEIEGSTLSGNINAGAEDVGATDSTYSSGDAGFGFFGDGSDTRLDSIELGNIDNSQSVVTGTITENETLFSPTVVGGATTAAGDYVVRRNASNTDTIPNAGSDLTLLWDTAVANEGSNITYSAGTFTLGATGRYLVLCSDQHGTTSTTNNERLNTKMVLYLGGTELTEGYCTSYIRKTGGSQEYINFSAAVINVTSTTGNADELQVRKERIDNTAGVGEEPDRIADRSGILILKLDDSWNYGRYESSADTSSSGTDNTAVTLNIQTTNEEDSPFTRTTNTVDVATTNPVLALYSVRSTDATPAGRAEYQFRLTNNGTAIPGSYSQCYIRVTDNCDWGGACAVTLIDPTSGDDIELEVISRELGGETFQAHLDLIELPSTAKAIIVEATTGSFNETTATNFTWDTNPYIDTDVFTHTAGNANLDVDVADDYLAFCSFADDTAAGTTAARAVPAAGFRVNTTDNETAGNSCYNRGTGTADHSAIAFGTLLTGLAANDSVYARIEALGTLDTDIACDSGAMSLVQLGSLFSNAQSIVTGTITENETLFSATVSAGAVSVATGLITENETLFSATVSTSTTVATGTVTENETLFSASPVVGAVSIATGTITENETLFAVTVSSSISVATGLITENETLFSATPVAGAVSVATGLITENETLFSATPSPGAVTVATGTITENETLFSPAVAQGVSVATGTITENETLFSATVVPGATSIATGLITENEVLFSPTVIQGAIVATGQITETETLFSVTVSAGPISIATGTITENEQLFAVTGIVAAPEEAEAEAPSGGYEYDRFWFEFDQEQERRRRRLEKRRRKLEEAQRIKDQLEQQLALAERELEAQAARKRELQRLTAIARRGRAAIARLGKPRVVMAADAAIASPTFSKMERLERELRKAIKAEEDEMLAASQQFLDTYYAPTKKRKHSGARILEHELKQIDKSEESFLIEAARQLLEND